ncbi:hypothetical protein FACS189492_2960 [Clostridia bacterium]|nr:hypothetical protein FACS189492_2960 [Clostridia bacterium]
MRYNEAVRLLFEKLGTHKIMAQAASADGQVTVRNVSCMIYDGKIYFKTDKNFRKTKQLLLNPNTALCVGGVQIEGVARSMGLVAEEAGARFEKLYEKYWPLSYNAYPHTESEILIEITPRFAEIWDQHENNCGFQIFIDFDQQTASSEEYDLL